jgi:hypothetical protein
MTPVFGLSRLSNNTSARADTEIAVRLTAAHPEMVHARALLEMDIANPP